MNHLTRFRQLHTQGFVLYNAWDASSARMLEKSGALAIGTTSAGVAYTHGRRDEQTLSRDEMAQNLREVCRAVDVPVTADLTLPPFSVPV